MRNKAFFSIFIILFLSVLVGGCGSSGESDSETMTTISGSVFANHIGGAEVTVLEPGGMVLAGPVLTSTEGTYSVDVPESALAGDIIIESSGGHYADEATGKSPVLAGKLSAYVAGGTLSAGSAVHLTPASTIVSHIVDAGKSISEAENIFNKGFGFVPDLSVKPDDATNPAATSSHTERLAGLQAAAFSQLTQDVGLSPEKQFELLAAVAKDLSDSSLDGEDASGHIMLTSGSHLPEDIQNRYERALIQFRSEGRDKSGLTADKIGVFPFGRIALNNNYRLEYLEGMMPAMQGKTMFKIRVLNRHTGNPVPGLMLKLMPMMHMSAHSHSTPVGTITDNGDGTYTCEVYYLMASMMNNMSMGFWELKVMVGPSMETVYFYPNVMMNMAGGTIRSVLKGINDKIAGMAGVENRSYYLFNDGLSGSAGNYGFKLFIAAKESMMSYPAVDIGKLLNDEVGGSWSVAAMIVEVSTDGVSWTAAVNDGSGKWSVAGLYGLTKDIEGNIYLRLTVNGEQKTVDGNLLAADGSNGYGTFKVTPKN